MLTPDSRSKRYSERGDVGELLAIDRLRGDDFCERIDYKNYVRKEDLIGYHEAIKRSLENGWMR